MTHRYLSRFTLLLFLALTALAGCDPNPPPPPPPAPTYSEVQFEVTVPPETAVGGSLFVKGSDPALSGNGGQGVQLVHQGGQRFSAKARVLKDQAFTYSVHTVLPAAQVELDAAGAVVPERKYTAREDAENLTLTVERWGPASGVSQAQTVFLVQVPETSLENGVWLSGNHAALGGGKPDGVKLYKAVNNRYATVVSFPPETSLQYTVTRGSAATVEANLRGEELTRTHTTARGFERVSLTVGWWKDEARELTFQVTVPPETPADARVFLKGSHERLGGTGLELTWQGGTTFSAQVPSMLRQEFTYGAWMTSSGSAAPQADLTAAGVAQPARTYTVQGDATVNVTVERWGPESGAGTEPQTVFVVAVPSNTPATDTIWLSGNHALLGNWNGAGVQLYKAVNGRHAARLSFAPGTSLQYKATRGSWGTVEKGSAGEEIDNRTLTTGSGFERTFLTVARWSDLGGVPPPQVLTGNIEYLRDVTPTNTALKKRDVIIWLPPDYHSNSTRHYPVLYMHDGQNLMDATTAFAGEWGVDETAQQLVGSGQVEPVIIVGVYNTGADRIAEYTQVPDPKYAQYGGDRGGKADEYGAFLVNDLKPLIDGKYRTKPEAQYTGLAGSSLGGLVSLYLGMKHPGTFTRLGVISPSVFWGEKDIVSRVNALPGKLPLRIWEDMGTDEASTDSPETVEDARLLRDALVGKGWVVDSDLKYTEIPGGKHNEKAWAARFGDILKYLYPPVQ